MESSRIERINELAHLSKVRALTEAEKAEQQLLREEYLRDFRANFRRQLEAIEIVPDVTESPE